MAESIYIDFLDKVKMLTNNDISKYTDNVTERLTRFHTSLVNEDLFLLFSMSKIKVFSAKTVETHNVSTSLFRDNTLTESELTLKQLFNNMPDTTKNQLWELLFNMYIMIEQKHDNLSTRISLLKGTLKNMKTNLNSKSDMFKNIINTDVNSTTTNMLDDIIGSFQNIVGTKGNPFDNIMGITEMITSKYGSKIENGEVEIDKILGGMGGLLGKDMNLGNAFGKFGNAEDDKPVIIDENYSTSNIDVGVEEKNEGMNFNFSKLAPLANMVNKIGSIGSENDVLSLKKDMDNFMEKELKVDMTQYKEHMDKLEKQLETSLNPNND